MKHTKAKQLKAPNIYYRAGIFKSWHCEKIPNFNVYDMPQLDNQQGITFQAKRNHSNHLPALPFVTPGNLELYFFSIVVETSRDRS